MSPTSMSNESAVAALCEKLESANTQTVWSTLSILTAQLPTESDVIDARRNITFDGASGFLTRLLTPQLPSLFGAAILFDRRVELLRDEVLVDVSHTSRVEFATGIQRVVRETVRRWNEAHRLYFVSWTADGRSLRRLERHEILTTLTGTPAIRRRSRAEVVIVPLSGHFLLPELNIDARSLARTAALARFSGLGSGVIGYDQVPITSGETTDGAMPAAFALNLAAVRWMDEVIAISSAAAEEYGGWRRMLGATGISGPSISVVRLPIEAHRASESSLAEARQRLRVGDLPMLLCVGSHEPRKNHLAVLFAAEMLWREGLEFSLAFIGGNAWNSDEFSHRFDELVQMGRPLRRVVGLDDHLLWAAYALSKATIFPSLNEGFGLPVAESLAAGVPVVTSNFGSTAEIASHGGAVLIDPRNDDSLIDGMRSMLTDVNLYSRLKDEALRTPLDSWDQYAARAWDALFDRVQRRDIVNESE
jgi:glycosyltransferase involved in cell wall biosynthesis